MSLLSRFGHLSGYKLNLQKSELFPINDKAQTLNFTYLPFKIESYKLSYLGVSVTRKYKDLFRKNLLVLLNQVKPTLTQWSPLSMSLVGRVNSIKMTILPQFLYIFQALPLFIPRSFSDQFDSLITSYIWQGKRPRLNKSHLQKIKANGMVLLNFCFYYWSINLHRFAFWSHFHGYLDPPNWVAMELHSEGNIYIPALLGSIICVCIQQMCMCRLRVCICMCEYAFVLNAYILIQQYVWHIFVCIRITGSDKGLL